MPIRELPEEVSSAIAAGEVVERPASIVRELVENALDASARSIVVRIAEGGKSLIQVADDGGGIPPNEVELAVQRYTTSKLATVEDLQAIRSLGFRGEALASIGAISRMQITTRSNGEEGGTLLEVEGGHVGTPEAIGRAVGTTVRVRDLFFNVPARRRFLKSNTTERGWISRLVTRYALAYPGVRFSLESDGRQRLATAGDGNPLDALAEVYGLEKAQQLIPVQGATAEQVRVSGFVSPPFLNRSNRREITLFVNGRWVQDVSLAAAVTQAYHTLLMVGRHPIALLFIELPPEQVDVNVHPAKAEVRFTDPGLIFSIVQRAVRATLLGQSPVKPATLSPMWSAETEPAWSPDVPQETRTVVPPDQKAMFVPVLRSIGQVGATYLVAEGPDGVYLIDQHAAHERVLFERLMKQVAEKRPESQGLLEAVTVEFSPRDAELIENNLETLSSLGFHVEPFGTGAYQIRAVPAAVSELSPELALRTVAEDFEEDEAPLAAEQEARLAARVCKRAAIKAGQVLSLEEQRELVRDLENCATPRTCPHGRPTMVHLSVASLERQFGRRA